MTGYNISRRLFDHPGDMGLGIMTPQAVESRQGMDDVADGACFDNKNMHRLKNSGLTRFWAGVYGKRSGVSGQREVIFPYNRSAAGRQPERLGSAEVR